MRRMPLIALVAIVLAGCDGTGGDLNVRLDSAGSKIQRAGEKVGGKLDTAFSDVKNEINEAQIQEGLHRMSGMENIKVDLKDSVARLYGSVPTEGDRGLATQIVSRVKGVARVTDELTVGAPDTIRVDTARRGSDGAVRKKI